jgi:DNA-binding ferritin-like protein (Dps family)
MNNVLGKLMGDRRNWKRMEARANALPRDYRIVYEEMKCYMWRFTAGDGTDIVAILEDVLAEFEAAVADGKRVLGVTGEDVAAYCSARLGDLDLGCRYLESLRNSLNQDVKKQL